MKLKKMIALGILGISIAISGHVAVHGAPLTTRELVDDYLRHENDPPEEPFLVTTTAYYHGDICCRGVKPREGIAAGPTEWYGYAAVIYEAIETEKGYEQGVLIGIFEILDTGYGKSTGDGVPSKVRKDKGSRGTIEVGQCIDIYRHSYQAAKEWMRLTGGKAFVQIIPAEG